MKSKINEGWLVHKNSKFGKPFIYRVLTIKKHPSSGQTDKKLCKEYGISLSTLYRWQRQFKSPSDLLKEPKF